MGGKPLVPAIELSTIESAYFAAMPALLPVSGALAVRPLGARRLAARSSLALRGSAVPLRLAGNVAPSPTGARAPLPRHRGPVAAAGTSLSGAPAVAKAVRLEDCTIVHYYRTPLLTEVATDDLLREARLKGGVQGDCPALNRQCGSSPAHPPAPDSASRRRSPAHPV